MPGAHDNQLAGVVLVLGGARSGKSAYAEHLAEQMERNPVLIATLRNHQNDAEMQDRIRTHLDRRGKHWCVREEPVALAEAIDALARPGRAIVIDCLTLWLSNLMEDERDIEEAGNSLLDGLARANGPVILVSNEVGLGIVPMHPLGRRFRDIAGILHQKIAAMASQVIFIVAGLPMILKPGPIGRTTRIFLVLSSLALAGCGRDGAPIPPLQLDPYQYPPPASIPDRPEE